jgi:hypothetical protein
LHGQSLHVSQPVGGIQAGKAGAHNYCINVSVGHAATMLCCDPSHIGLMTPMDTCRDTCFFRQTLLVGMADIAEELGHAAFIEFKHGLTLRDQLGTRRIAQ